MDEELKQLGLAIAEARRLSGEALDALRVPQATLRAAAMDYIELVAMRRVDASRRASVEVMAKLSDDDIAELRSWAEEQIALVRSVVDSEIETCDFWIPETSGMSLGDVNVYGAALMPRPKDSPTGSPRHWCCSSSDASARCARGFAVIGLASVPAEAERRLELALVRAWRDYRELAIDCIAKWADVDERYHASAARFQELRWELAAEVDLAALQARRAAEEAEGEQPGAAAAAIAAAAAAAVEADSAEPLPDIGEPVVTDAVVRSDSETLIPITG